MSSPTTFSTHYWKDDLPLAVARQFDRLASTLPKGPRRSSLDMVPTTLMSSSPSTNSAPSQNEARGSGRPHASDASALSTTRTTIVPSGNKRDKEVVQEQQLRTALDEARTRAELLEKRLNSRLVSDHFVGLDRLIMEEVYGRRTIEGHHMELLEFITGSWERVQCAMRQTEEMKVMHRDLEFLFRDNEREVQRLRNQIESQERVVKNLKLHVKDHGDVVEELATLRAGRAEETARRVAAERSIADLKKEKKQLKLRVKELDATVSSFQSDLGKLSTSHSHIVGELEHSLRVMLLGTARDQSCGGDTTTSMAPDISISQQHVDAERRKLELQFQLQDATRELQELRTVNRNLRAQISEETLAHQEVVRAMQAEMSSLQKSVSAHKRDHSAKAKELSRCQAELARLETTARELGKCRGHLAIAERRVEILEKQQQQRHHLLDSDTANATGGAAQPASEKRQIPSERNSTTTTPNASLVDHNPTNTTLESHPRGNTSARSRAVDEDSAASNAASHSATDVREERRESILRRLSEMKRSNELRSVGRAALVAQQHDYDDRRTRHSSSSYSLSQPPDEVGNRRLINMSTSSSSAGGTPVMHSRAEDSLATRRERGAGSLTAATAHNESISSVEVVNE